MSHCERCGALVQWSDYESGFVCPVHGLDTGKSGEKNQ